MMIEKTKTIAAFGAALMFLCLAPIGALANGDGNGIKNSPHDFTDNYVAEELDAENPENDDANVNAWNNKRKEICRTCHVPHDHAAVRYGNQGLLWNHQLTTKDSWTMYGAGAGQISKIDGTQEPAPAGTSKLCLGCHDGVSGINYYDGKTAADAKYGFGTTYLMGDYDSHFVVGNTAASLSNNHPISISYDNLTDQSLHDPAAAVFANGDTVDSHLVFGRVECSTCHDVHNRESVGGTHLLRSKTKGDNVSGAGASELCFVCHDK